MSNFLPPTAILKEKVVVEEQDELRQLIEKAKVLDREAFGRIYDIFYDRIYKYTYFKVGNLTEAEDLTAQTFTGALKAIENFTWQGSSFASWLFRIANNVVVDYYRAAGRYGKEPLEDHLSLAGSVDPVKTAIDNISFAKAQAAIAGLPEEQRQVVILKFISDMSNSETAKVMGKTEGAIKSLQFRALENLRRLLKSEKDESVSGSSR